MQTSIAINEKLNPRSKVISIVIEIKIYEYWEIARIKEDWNIRVKGLKVKSKDGNRYSISENSKEKFWNTALK